MSWLILPPFHALQSRGPFAPAPGGGGSGDTFTNAPAAITLSNGNLTMHMASDNSYAQGNTRSGNAISGKKFAEFKIDDLTGTDASLAIGVVLSTAANNIYLGSGGSDGGYVVAGDGATAISTFSIRSNNDYVDDFATGMAVNDTIQVAVDQPNLLIWFRRNNTGNWNNSGTANPATGVGGKTLGAGTWHWVASGINGTGCSVNFSGTGAVASPPSGFSWHG